MLTGRKRYRPSYTL